MHATLNPRVTIVAAVFGIVAALGLCHGTASARTEVCKFTTSTGIAFGSFDVFVAPLAITGTVSGRCRYGSGSLPALSVTIGNGLNYQSNGNRAMSCTTCTGIYTSDLLQYQIYTDGTLTTPWIGSTAMTATNPCPCGGTWTAWGPLTLYGLIATPVPGGVNDSSVGTYSDTVVLTLNY